jgi:hypothetical protein
MCKFGRAGASIRCAFILRAGRLLSCPIFPIAASLEGGDDDTNGMQENGPKAHQLRLRDFTAA